jgi:hypothetical protein
MQIIWDCIRKRCLPRAKGVYGSIGVDGVLHGVLIGPIDSFAGSGMPCKASRTLR